MRSWLRSSAERFGALRLFGAKARTEVARNINADAIAHSNRIAIAAHSAETHDREALAIFDRILADGQVSEDELTDLLRGVRLIRDSAETDHDIAEAATVQPEGKATL
jgi:hypothetical protein